MSKVPGGQKITNLMTLESKIPLPWLYAANPRSAKASYAMKRGHKIHSQDTRPFGLKPCPFPSVFSLVDSRFQLFVSVMQINRTNAVTGFRLKDHAGIFSITYTYWSFSIQNFILTLLTVIFILCLEKWRRRYILLLLFWMEIEIHQKVCFIGKLIF